MEGIPVGYFIYVHPQSGEGWVGNVNRADHTQILAVPEPTPLGHLMQVASETIAADMGREN